MRSTVYLLTFALLPIAARAEFYSGADLLERLHDDRRIAAMAYVAGVFDTSWQRVQCAPSTVTLAGATNMVEFFLSTVQEPRLQQPAHQLVLSTLAAAWPCPRRDPRAPIP